MLGLGLTGFGLIVTIPWSLVDLAFVLLGRFTDVEGNSLA